MTHFSKMLIDCLSLILIKKKAIPFLFKHQYSEKHIKIKGHQKTKNLKPRRVSLLKGGSQQEECRDRNLRSRGLLLRLRLRLLLMLLLRELMFKSPINHVKHHRSTNTPPPQHSFPVNINHAPKDYLHWTTSYSYLQMHAPNSNSKIKSFSDTTFQITITKSQSIPCISTRTHFLKSNISALAYWKIIYQLHSASISV